MWTQLAIDAPASSLQKHTLQFFVSVTKVNIEVRPLIAGHYTIMMSAV